MHEPAVLFGTEIGDAAETLDERIRQAGLRVDIVRSGPEVIEKALFHRYDAIVVDSSVNMLEPTHVRDLLKANPRTQSLPILLIDLQGLVDDRDAGIFIQNPLSDLRWLDPIRRATDASLEDGSIHADLSEIQLPDLIQMLIQNGRTGVIEVDANGRFGRIEVGPDTFGRITQDESTGGLKALARILAWERGRIRFQPDPTVDNEMQGSALSILLDGVRLCDEAADLRSEIPPGSRLVYKPRQDGNVPQDSLLEEILLLVDFYGAVDDILERLEQPDADILRSIIRLRDEDWVEIRLPGRGSNGVGGNWSDIAVDSRVAEATNPVVWMIGRDADYSRVLWADARMQQRLLARKSLRNNGRFGGNGWLVNVGESVFVWLRWIQPDKRIVPFLTRPEVNVQGAVVVMSERDEGYVEDMIDMAYEFADRAVPSAWLPLDHTTGVEDPAAWIEAAGEEFPGILLTPGDDSVTGFWQALSLVLEGQTGRPEDT